MPNSNGLNSVEARVNTYTANEQVSPALAMLAGGGYVVAWTSNGQDGSSYGVYFQRYDASGTAQGGETQANTFTPNYQLYPQVAALTGGGYVVTWTSLAQDGSGQGIYLQRYDGVGVAQGAETLVNSFTNSDQGASVVAGLTGGGYVVTWTSNQDSGGGGFGIYSQRYTALGVADGAETHVSTYTPNQQIDAAVSALADGGYVIGWSSDGQDGSNYGIYTQRYDALGVAQGGETLVNTTVANSQQLPVIAMNGTGYVVTWQSIGQDPNGTAGIYMQRYDATGAPLGVETRVNTYIVSDQYEPAITPISGGGYVISWTSFGQDGSGTAVALQRFDVNGVAVGNEQQANVQTSNNQNDSALLALSNGNLVVAWNDASGALGDSQGIAMRTLTVAAPVTPGVSVNNVTANEGNTGTTSFIFTVSLSAPSPQTVTVNYSTANGTAVAGSDYAATTGTLTFAPGQTSGTVPVSVTGDTVYEGDQTFALNLVSSTNAFLATSTGTGTITNDDAAPTLAINDVTVSEAAGTATFTITRTGATEVPISVGAATADGTAVSTAGGPGTPDFTAVNTTVNFTPSLAATATQTVNVTLTNDAVYEAAEQFVVNLSGATGATIADAQGVGTITNDDAAPTISIGNVTVSESGGPATFTVTLTGATALPISVNYATANGTAVSAASATPGTPDYASTAGTLTFGPSAAGTQTLTIAVPITNDNVYEAVEQFAVNLTGPTNGATITTAQGIGTITNDDASPTISIGNVTVSEAGGPATFTVTLTGATALPISVNYATADGTAVSAGSATPGTPDYTTTAGTLTFNPSASGTQTLTIAVPVTNDNVYEAVEQFAVNLTGPTNGATITTAQGVGTITNDDPAPTISIGNVTVSESGGPATFTVTLTGATALPIAVNYATADGTAVSAASATPGTPDYSSTAGTLTFNPSAAGTQTLTVAVPITNDSIFENTEQFAVNLTGPTNGATITGAQGIGTITNEDNVGVVSISSPTIVEGDAGTSTLTFTITRAGGTAPFSLTYRTADGTATVANADYVSIPNATTLNFAAGVNSQTVGVTINGDTRVEADENFSLVLEGLTQNGTFSNNGASLTGTGTITNDDASGPITINSVNVNENGGAAVLTVTRGGNGTAPFTVDYATSNNSAIAGQDYTAATGTLTFGIGINTQTITVPILDDTVFERQEAFTVTLSNPTNGAVVSGTAGVVVIIDNDPQIDNGPPAPTPTPTPTPTPAPSGDYVQPAGDSQTAISTGDPNSTQPFNVTGNSGNQVITGNNGNNIINGGGGNDTMIGLGGNDTYLVRSLGDVVIEANGGGNDLIYTTVSYNLGVNEVEALSTVQQTDTTPINLIGNFATQIIVGNYGNNVLNGGTGGIDSLVGLLGNDTYAVGDSRTIIVEKAGEGFDTLVASVSYTLAAGVSIELFTAQDRAATTALTLRGNEIAQTIAGNEGANILDGGGGNDVLIGGGGADRFDFSTALGANNVDAITDFQVGVDKIGLASNIFTGMAGGITAANFTTGPAATTIDQHLIYNQATGQLFFDADGSGSGAAVLFALVTPGTALTAASFEQIVPVATTAT